MTTATESKMAEWHTIAECARRFHKQFPHIEQMGIVMDIQFAHDETPMRLDELLHAEDSDFFHDVCGIYTNFNRSTLTMDNCFLPRYTAS